MEAMSQELVARTGNIVFAWDEGASWINVWRCDEEGYQVENLGSIKAPPIEQTREAFAEFLGLEQGG